MLMKKSFPPGGTPMPDSGTRVVNVPDHWAARDLLVRAWMKTDEPAPTWNGQPTIERRPDRGVPYASEETLCWPGARWDWPRFCLEREFVAQGARTGANTLAFPDGSQTRGQVTIGTMPTRYGRCGQTWTCRARQSLNGDDWRFKLVRSYEEGEELRLAGFKGVRKNIRVPSNWEVAGFSKPTYGQWRDESPSIGMYNRSFSLDVPHGKRAHLVFEGANNNTTVWLNGALVGEHESGYTPFVWDITEAAKQGANDLSLRVAKYSRSAFFENAGQIGYWYLGGVFRPVWVVITPSAFISGFRYDPVFEPGFKRVVVTVTAEITASEGAGGRGHLRVSMEGPDGELHEGVSDVLSLPAAPPGGTARRLVQVRIEVPTPALWSAETPNLYKIRIGLEGDTLDAVEELVGLRELRIDGQLFKVNGVPVKLRGMCRHDFSPTDGYATRPELWKKDLALMRKAGINAVRCSHYSPAEGFIRLCEKMGFYVLQESAAMWVGENADTWYPDYHVRAEETLRRDINRACVLAWSLGNEHADTVNFRRAALMCRRSDSRPVIYAGSADTLDGDIATPHYVGDRIAKYVDGEPKRPVICTEDFTQSRGWWPLEPSINDSFKSYWDDIVLPEDRINGVFIWEWDERAIVYKNGILLSNTKPYVLNSYESMVGPWRRVSLPWYNALREVFAPIRVDATPEGSRVRVLIRNQYDFTDLGQITAVWKLSRADASIKPRTVLAHGDTTITLSPRSRESFSIDAPNGAEDWRVLDIELRSEVTAILSRRIYVPPTERPSAIVATPATASLTADAKGGRRELSVGASAAIFDARTGRLCGMSGKHCSVAVGGPIPNLWITPPGASLGGFPNRSESLDGGRVHVDRADAAVSAGRGGVVCAMHLDRAGNPITLVTHAMAVKEGLHIRYTLSYGGQAVRVPAVGIRLELPGSFSSWKWRGRGPWATYPGLAYAADPGVYEAPIVTKRRVGPSIPMAEEHLVGQWEEQGGTKSDVDRFWLESPKGTLPIELGRTSFVECERVGDRVEVRINTRVAELGDRQVPLEGCEGELLIRWPTCGKKRRS
jgi:beta-galactosidase